jgi:glycosyltransferase involved in cell wall biosynthesis
LGDSAVCLLSETYYPVVGGGETQARMLAESLVANGFDVIVLTRRSDPSFQKSEQFGRIRVYRMGPTGSTHLKKWGLLFTSLPMLIRLRRHYDVLFVSGFRVLGVPAVLMGMLFGKPCILKADSNGEMSGEFFVGGLARLGLTSSSLPVKLMLAMRNKILRRADRFVALSSEIATELQSHGVHTSRIHRIPNGVNIQIFRPVSPEDKRQLRQTLGIPLQATTIIFTGRLVSYKGLPLLLRVWRELRRKHPQVYLLLVGSGGLGLENCEAELKQYVAAHSLEDSVVFTGDVDPVHHYLQASDIFVFPTENEAFGISLIEAMACGLPVISTRAGGIRDILQHRRNGLVVEAGDFQQLFDALNSFIRNSPLSARLGKAAWQTVQDSYSTEIVGQAYIELFRHATHPSISQSHWISQRLFHHAGPGVRDDPEI